MVVIDTWIFPLAFEQWLKILKLQMCFYKCKTQSTWKIREHKNSEWVTSSKYAQQRYISCLNISRIEIPNRGPVYKIKNNFIIYRIRFMCRANTKINCLTQAVLECVRHQNTVLPFASKNNFNSVINRIRKTFTRAKKESQKMFQISGGSQVKTSTRSATWPDKSIENLVGTMGIDPFKFLVDT